MMDDPNFIPSDSSSPQPEQPEWLDRPEWLEQPDQPEQAEQPEPIRKRRRSLLAVGVGAAVVAGGVGVALAGGAPSSAASGPTTVPVTKVTQVTAQRAVEADGELELGDVTLDELAAELAEHGLVLQVEPEGSTTGGSDTDSGDEDSADDGSDHDHDHDEFGEPEPPAGAFPVDGDQIDVSSASTPEIAEKAQAIWDRFVEIIPADQRQMVVSFELTDPDFGGAYVYPSDDDPSRWVLGMSPDLGADTDYILIHEFAHLLSLQAKEVPPDPDFSEIDSCPTYYTGEGCAIQDSLINEFVQTFWPAERLAKVKELEEAGEYEELDEYLTQVYEENPDEFVTDYASVNPAEDFAETFAHFVTTDRPDGDTIAEQKILMLWNDPAMVDLRAQIVANMA